MYCLLGNLKLKISEERFNSLDKNGDILNTHILQYGSWLKADQVGE